MSPPPQTSGLRFDPEALYLALDKKRRADKLSWRGVARQIGLKNVHTGPRLGRGVDVHADTFIRLLLWLGETDVAPYLTSDHTTTTEGATTA